MKTRHQRYDIIGDIHGHADTLRALLKKLGYVETNGVYCHPERLVIFVGDFIDRGPKIRETLQIVRAMVDAGTALAVMGNHEYNALCFHTRNGYGGFLRPHTKAKAEQHQATLDQIAKPFPDEWKEWLEWFKTLPLFLDLGRLRVVHACWDNEQIAVLHASNRLSDGLLRASATKGTPEYDAIEVLLKGKEIKLPDGHTFTTKDGQIRHEIRVKWWVPADGRTYHALSLPTYDTAPKVPVPASKSLEGGYATKEPPVIVGHYWLVPAKPARLAPNIACVDYSVATEGGMLVAYRWDGEDEIYPSRFVYTNAIRPPVLPDDDVAIADLPRDKAYAEISIIRNRTTGKNWLRYFHEHHAFTASQQLFWCEVPDADLATITAETARAYINGRNHLCDDCGDLSWSSIPLCLYGD